MTPEIPFRRNAVEPVECIKGGWETVKNQYWFFTVSQPPLIHSTGSTAFRRKGISGVILFFLQESDFKNSTTLPTRASVVRSQVHATCGTVYLRHRCGSSKYAAAQGRSSSFLHKGNES